MKSTQWVLSYLCMFAWDSDGGYTNIHKAMLAVHKAFGETATSSDTELVEVTTLQTAVLLIKVKVQIKSKFWHDTKINIYEPGQVSHASWITQTWKKEEMLNIACIL